MHSATYMPRRLRRLRGPCRQAENTGLLVLELLAEVNKTLYVRVSLVTQ